jgi:hypothetical protein
VDPLKGQTAVSRSSSRQTDKVVAFRLSPEDHQLLQSVALPLSPGQLARALVMQAAGLAPLPPGRRPLPRVQDADLLRACLCELGHLGGNLNQLAHVANMSKQPTAETNIDALRRELEPIKQRIMVALGVTP